MYMYIATDILVIILFYCYCVAIMHGYDSKYSYIARYICSSQYIFYAQYYTCIAYNINVNNYAKHHKHSALFLYYYRTIQYSLIS